MFLGVARSVATRTGMTAVMAKTTSLERLLMSRLLRRYVECLIVVFFPWVLLTEQEAKAIEGGDWGASVPLRPD